MSLADATWQEFARGANVQESWVLWLYDSNGGVLRLGDKDSSLGGYTTHGMVTDWGDIRRSIDLSKFSASVDNVTVRVTNAMYHGAKLIETIGPHTAGYKYINREVRIVSYLNGNAASEMRLYTGRLRNLKWTADEIELDIEQAQPWDFIRIPDTVDSRTQTPIPVVYGAFTANASNYATSNYCTGKLLWPVKIVRRSATLLAGHSLHDPGTARLHIYEQTPDLFVPIVDSVDAYWDSAALEPGEAYYTLAADGVLRHAFKAKGEYDTSDAWEDFTDPELAFDDLDTDDGSSTYATATKSAANSFGDYLANFILPFNVPNTITDKPDGLYIIVRYRITLNAGALDGGHSQTIYFEDSSGVKDSDTVTIDGTWRTVTLQLTDNPVPSNLSIRFLVYGTAATANFTVDVADIRLDVETRINEAGDPQAIVSVQDDIEHLYCSGNGLEMSWSAGNPVEHIHELHRDVLHRFCGHTTTPTGWAALNTARGSGAAYPWLCRYWQHEKTDVREILEQAQFEGAFIFVWDMTATGTGRYLLPQASYSSSDVVATIVEARDTTGLEYSHTPFEDLVTKQVISYQRHPADSRYIATWTETNATARTAWNIQTLENVEQVELDMLVDDGAVQDWASIRDNIFGDLKRIVSTTILNPRWFIIEIGDIVQFDGDARYYMVTDERRTMGRLTITAREVYA